MSGTKVDENQIEVEKSPEGLIFLASCKVQDQSKSYDSYIYKYAKEYGFIKNDLTTTESGDFLLSDFESNKLVVFGSQSSKFKWLDGSKSLVYLERSNLYLKINKDSIEDENHARFLEKFGIIHYNQSEKTALFVDTIFIEHIKTNFKKRSFDALENNGVIDENGNISPLILGGNIINNNNGNQIIDSNIAGNISQDQQNLEKNTQPINKNKFILIIVLLIIIAFIALVFILVHFFGRDKAGDILMITIPSIFNR